MIYTRKRRYILLLSTLIFLLGSTFFYFQFRKDLKVGENVFIERHFAHYKEVSSNLNTLFGFTYDSIRTMSMLPAVRHLTPSSALTPDGKLTIQQIYNSIAERISVSEIYFTFDGFNPDRIDPKTKKPEAPAITFDQVIVGKNAAAPEQKSELPEIEIYEYRQMVDQIRAFKSTVPEFPGLNLPMQISPSVITCDNSEFTIQMKDSGNDSYRTGVVISVPFYDDSNRLRGIVSAIIRDRVIRKFLTSPELILKGPHHVFQSLEAQEGDHDAPALERKFKSSLGNKILAGDWHLEAEVPRKTFESDSLYKAPLFVFLGKLSLLFSCLMVLLVFFRNDSNLKRIGIANEILFFERKALELEMLQKQVKEDMLSVDQIVKELERLNKEISLFLESFNR